MHRIWRTWIARVGRELLGARVIMSIGLKGSRSSKVFSFRLLLVVLCQLPKPSAHPPTHATSMHAGMIHKFITIDSVGSVCYTRLLSQLRGGGRREARELTVPSSECPTLDVGIEAVCKVDTLFLRKGVHRWKDSRKVGRRTLNIMGEDGSLLIGQWIMWEGSKGTLKKLAMAADSNQMGAVHTVLIHDGSWTLESCIVQSINGIALEVRERAHVELRSCTVGGGGEEEYLAKTGRARSLMLRICSSTSDFDTADCGSGATGLIIASHANVSMLGGSIVFCDTAGVRMMDTGRLTLKGCRVCKNQVGISLQGECVVHVRDCSLSNIVASLRIDEQSRYTAQVFMSGNQVDGTAWYGDRVPARQPSDPADQVGDEDWSDPDVVEHMQQGSRSFV